MICVVCRVLLGYHKMTSLNSLLVIVLLLAVIFPEVIETAKCFRSEHACRRVGGKRHDGWCRRSCKARGKDAIACHRKNSRCYGCKCFTTDIRKSPEIAKDRLEENPLEYIYRLIKKYIERLRRKPKYTKP